MILIVHIIFGAAIGSLLVKNPILAVVLAFLSHYFLDFFPHIEYPITNGDFKQWRKIMPTFLRVALDFFFGILLIMIFSKNQLVIYICGLFAAIPDAFTVLRYIKPNKILESHYQIHQKIQFLKHKKIPVFWRVITQVVVIAISIILLRI